MGSRDGGRARANESAGLIVSRRKMEGKFVLCGTGDSGAGGGGQSGADDDQQLFSTHRGFAGK